MKQFNTIPNVVDTGLIIPTVITEWVSIAAFAIDASIPVEVAISGTSLHFSLTIVVRKNPIKYLLYSKIKTRCH